MFHKMSNSTKCILIMLWQKEGELILMQNCEYMLFRIPYESKLCDPLFW